jgi:hypothetical protein
MGRSRISFPIPVDDPAVEFAARLWRVSKGLDRSPLIEHLRTQALNKRGRGRPRDDATRLLAANLGSIWYRRTGRVPPLPRSRSEGRHDADGHDTSPFGRFTLAVVEHYKIPIQPRVILEYAARGDRTDRKRVASLRPAGRGNLRQTAAPWAIFRYRGR